MKKFAVIDCYNTVFNHEEDGWDYKVSITDYVIDVSTKDTTPTILSRLYDVGYFREHIGVEDAYAQWLDTDLIVINAVDTHEPICRLELLTKY